WQRESVIKSQDRKQYRIRTRGICSAANEKAAVAWKMRETHKRPVAVRKVVRKIALADSIVNCIVATVNIGHVFQKIVDEEEKIHLVDVFGRLGKIISFIRLSFERRVV